MRSHTGMRTALQPLSILTLVLTLLQPSSAVFASPAHTSPVPLLSESSDSLPTRLIVETHPRGVFGILGLPSTAEVRAGIQQRTGITAQAVKTQGDFQIFSLGRHLNRTELAETLAKLNGMDGVGQVFEDAVAQPAGIIPNDPDYAVKQSYYYGPNPNTGGMDIQNAWSITTGSPSLTIAVLDTGITDHPDLNGRWTGGYDFVSNDADPHDPGDTYNGQPNSWHGTHVTGIIGATANNGIGIAGVNWNSKIIPVRVLGSGGGYIDEIADGIRWAAGLPVAGYPANPNPARLLNMSLGAAMPCDPYMQSAISAVVAQGGVVVVAAGNDSTDAANFDPASCPGVITVGATEYNQFDIASYSNYGSVVTVSAEGTYIYSTINDGQYTLGNPAYGWMSGTSMATPHVTAIISLMLSANPTLTLDQVKAILKQTAIPFPSSANPLCYQQKLCGAGMIDAGAAVMMAESFLTPPTPDPSGTLTPTNGMEIDSITPLEGYTGIDNKVVIAGKNLSAANLAWVGSQPLIEFSAQTDTQLSFSLPANSLSAGSNQVWLCQSTSCVEAPNSYQAISGLPTTYLPFIIQ